MSHREAYKEAALAVSWVMAVLSGNFLHMYKSHRLNFAIASLRSPNSPQFRGSTERARDFSA
jgi:hypothetical protein